MNLHQNLKNNFLNKYTIFSKILYKNLLIIFLFL